MCSVLFFLNFINFFLLLVLLLWRSTRRFFGCIFEKNISFFFLFLLLKGIRFASSFESSALPLSRLPPHDSRELVHILLHLLLLLEEEEDDQNLSKSSSSSSVSSSRKGAWRNFLLEFGLSQTKRARSVQVVGRRRRRRRIGGKGTTPLSVLCSPPPFSSSFFYLLLSFNKR